ncbi:CPBP family intramembrane glutamic endopeptidase [Halapricum hydrolyticum]|uniref:CPBP family intramembrane metalloprotease n=1 Tax=Halapricum hydrolyticum TaxID=2979991 RepID=A0AAE3ICA4_9EURY|nr:type II CAAX endopeptidase family protein [Halapricum hydrolyticum]MCU4718729.1 CPBP family intramembrane metalloprotease [Halapricum hydrolyticum]MCU4727716.1 CPBP family intramembrane metalloprotease [Halapricum hydrolyticum]
MLSLSRFTKALGVPFWNRDERRLRAGWRIVAMLALYLVLTISSMTAIDAGFDGYEEYAAPFALVLTAVLTVWLATQYLDRRPFRSLGLRLDRTWWREFGVGIGLGLFLTGGVLAIYLVAGWATIEGWFVAEERTFLNAFGLRVVIYAAVAFLEELLFRGYFITNATEGVPSRFVGLFDGIVPRRWLGAIPVVVAVFVSSLVFAHFHGDSLTAMQYIHFWLAGVLLALPYVLTGRLGASIGLHWAFNVGMTSLFNVEGGLPAFVRLGFDGPALWVGETALTETGMIVVTIGVVLLWARSRGLTGLDESFRRDAAEPDRSVPLDD